MKLKQLLAACLLLPFLVHAQSSTVNGRTYYENRAITGSTEDGQGDNYLLLHQVYAGTLLEDRQVIGLVSAVRGSTSSSNRKWTVQVNTSSAYNSDRGTALSYNEPADLVTLTYNGSRYLALLISNGSSLFNFSFTGYAVRESLVLAPDELVTNVSKFTGMDAVTINSAAVVAPIFNTGVVSIGGDTNGAVEVGKGNSSSATTYIDFHYGVGSEQDYNVRLINKSDHILDIISTGSDATLRVGGEVTAKKVRVTANPWADYVFDSTYPLRPLEEVEGFIRQNHYLPGMPAGREIAAAGLDIGDMERLQQLKIEELTLYLIEQDKKNHLLQQAEKLNRLSDAGHRLPQKNH